MGFCAFHLLFPKGVHSQFPGPVGHLPNRPGPMGGIGGPDVIHLQPSTINADFIQKLLGIGHPFFSSEISFQEMAVAYFSAADQKGIGPDFEGLQDVQDIDLPGAQELHDPHIVGILQPH